MNKIAYKFLLVWCVASLFVAPLWAQLPHLIFHAELNGAEQIPAVATNGKGLITLMYSPDRSKVTVTGRTAYSRFQPACRTRKRRRIFSR